MITINENYIDRFRKRGSEYLFYVCQGIFLGFNSDKQYIGLETYSKISNNQYVRIETKALNTLYRLGFIYDK